MFFIKYITNSRRYIFYFFFPYEYFILIDFLFVHTANNLKKKKINKKLIHFSYTKNN